MAGKLDRLRSLALAVLLLTSLGATRATAADCPVETSFPWPAPEWQTVPSPGEEAALAAFEAIAFPPGQDEADREGPRTNGLLVVKDGRIVYERYARGFYAERPHIFWSVSKSVLQAVYGAAVRDGHVDIDAPVAARSPWIGTGGKARMTYRHLLQMSSGLDFRETYEYAPLRSSVVAMLYTLGSADMARFAAGHGLAAEPGTSWRYKSGDSVILAGALRDAVGPERYADYPWTALFDPLGMTSVTWERDAAGTFVGSSYVYATPRDMARLGLLYAMDGCWNGRRLLPEGWVDFARALASPLAEPATQPWYAAWIDAGPASYGAHWWLNRQAAADRRPFPAAPADMLIASGHWGQKLWIMPGEGLVIVRTADDRSGFSSNDLLRASLAAFGGSTLAAADGAKR